MRMIRVVKGVAVVCRVVVAVEVCQYRGVVFFAVAVMTSTAPSIGDGFGLATRSVFVVGMF